MTSHLQRRRHLWRRFAGYTLLLSIALVFDLYLAERLANDDPDDGKLYSQMARNLNERGVFSAEPAEPFTPTLIRLPGYPLSIAGVYRFFGEGNDRAVRLSQGVLHFVAALIVGAIAWFWCPGSKRRRRKAYLAAFVLAAFCPFTAIYSATILTEVLTTLLLAICTLTVSVALDGEGSVALFWWAASGIYFGTAVLVRPDSGLFALGAGLTLIISYLIGRPHRKKLLRIAFEGAIFCAAFSTMLVPWTIRNEKVFDVFQPLSPRHAEAPGEFVPEGYFLWVRTWIDDQRYIGPALWDLEEKPITVDSLPESAFDSEEEKQRIAALLDQYNHSSPPDQSANEDQSDEGESTYTGDNEPDQAEDADEELDLSISPEVDAGFRQIANERIARNPIRYYIELPAKRGIFMWFDTHSKYYPFDGELFPLKDMDTETYQHLWLPEFAALVWLYTILAVVGAAFLWISKRGRIWLLLSLTLSLPRILYFSTLENPEPRYFVELFIFCAILAGIVLSRVRFRFEKRSIGIELTYP